MPTLKNLKHEAFCQHLITGTKHGLSQGTAYTKAGYNATPAAADVAACRLLKNAKINARIAELTAPTVRKTRATVDTLADQFDAVFNGAMGSEQFGAAGSAAAMKSKLLGFMRDKIEIGGVGEFSDCKSPDDIADRLIDEADGDIGKVLADFDAIRELIEARAAARAIPIRVGDRVGDISTNSIRPS